MSEVRAIQARVAAQDAALASKLETFRDQRRTVFQDAAQLAEDWARDCQRHGAPADPCARLRAAHQELQWADTHLLADAWRVEADHLRRVDAELGQLAFDAWDRATPAEPDPTSRSTAAQHLLGKEQVSRGVDAHLQHIAALRAEIDARVEEAAHRLGVDGSQRIALILAARASKARALAEALEDGAQALDEMVAMAQLSQRVAIAPGLRDDPLGALPPSPAPAAYGQPIRPPAPVYASPWIAGWAAPARPPRSDTHRLFGEVDRLHEQALRLHEEALRFHHQVHYDLTRGGW